MSSASTTSSPPTGLDRRSVLKAGAWAVPVVAVAVAAPAAAASTTANLALFGPQFGSSVPMFTSALTQRYSADEPAGVVVGNTTAQAYTGALILRLEVDRRLWDVTGFTYDARDGEGTRTASFTGSALSGDRVAYTITFAATVAANADPFTGVLVRPQLTFLGDYPNDALDPEDSVSSWSLVEPADADASDNLHVNGPGALVDATPFGATLTAEFESVASGSGSGSRPTRATLASVGPNPTRVDDEIAVQFDQALGDDVSVQDVTLNGQSAPDLLSPRSNTVSSTQRSVVFALTAPLEENDVVTFELAYAGGTGSTPTVRSQISYSSSTLNDPDQRALNRSYVNAPQD